MFMTTPLFKDWLRMYNTVMAGLAWNGALFFSTWIKLINGQAPDPEKGNKDGLYKQILSVEPPDWGTNLYSGNFVADESVYHRLWNFQDGEQGAIFIMPPYAGRRGEVVDRQIKQLGSLNASIYVFELKEADEANKDLTLDGYIDVLEHCLEFINEPAVIVGGCQGAWASFILSCRNPERVVAYVNLVGPLDFSAGNGMIQKNCQTIGPEFFRQVVDAHNGRQPGWMQWLGFASMAPHYFFLERYFKLFWALLEMRLNGNYKDVRKWITERNWMDDPRDLPGPWYCRVTEDLFILDKLRKGELVVKDEYVDPQRLNCPILAIGGHEDEITPYHQLDVREEARNADWYEYYVLPDHGHTKTLFSSESMRIVTDFIERVWGSVASPVLSCQG